VFCHVILAKSNLFSYPFYDSSRHILEFTVLLDKCKPLAT
jgi:hypothetical protein